MKKKWNESLTLLQELLTQNRLSILRGLLWHLEDWLAQQFLKTHYEQNHLLFELYRDVREMIIEPLAQSSKIAEVQEVLQPVCNRMKKVCEHIEKLHKFYRVFLSYAHNSPKDDWLIHFPEGLWTECHDLLSESMRRAMLGILNLHLPICQTPSSCYAWEAAHRLLQGSCKDENKCLACIEKAVVIAHVYNMKESREGLLARELAMRQENGKSPLQARVSMDLLRLADPIYFADHQTLCEQEMRWRGWLSRLLHPAKGSPSCYSMTMGGCNLHALLQGTLDQNSQCVIEQKPEHSHPVKQLLLKENQIDIHYKWRPRGFGLQLVAHYLYRYVLGGYSPCLDFVKIVGKDGFFQLSETIKGIPLEDLLAEQNHIPRFNVRSFSQNFIRILLDLEWDGKLNNYKAVPLQSDYELCNFDNEVVFHPPYTITRTAQGCKVEIHLKSIILCLNEMNAFLHPDVARRILQMDIAKDLRQVLIMCKQARRRMRNCFEEKEESQFWDQKTDPRYVGIPIQLRYLLHWYTTLWRIQQMLKKDFQITHWKILEVVFPLIADHVRKAHELDHPQQRFNFLNKQYYKEVSILKDGQVRKTMLTQHSRSVLTKCISPDATTPTHPSEVFIDLDAAFTRLSEFQRQSTRLSEVRAKLKDGLIAHFVDLPEQDQTFREQVLWGDTVEERISWPTLSPDKQQAVLKAMLNLPFNFLYLADCQALTKEMLLNLLDHSPTLQVLDLTGFKYFDPTLGLEIAKKASYLKELIITRSNVKELNEQGGWIYGPSKLSFPYLKRFEANDCANLVDVRLNAPQLGILLLNRCFRLFTLRMYVAYARRFEWRDCWLQFASELGLMAESEVIPKKTSHLMFSFKKNNEGQTILHGCALFNLVEQAEVLCKEGAKIEGDYSKRTPFHMAAQANHVPMLEMLIKKDPSLLQAEDANRDTPLHLGAISGSIEAVQWLLAKGADPKRVNRQYFDMMYLAAIHNRAELIRVLCAREGIKELIKTDYEMLNGRTPLHLAAVRAQAKLLKCYCDVEL